MRFAIYFVLILIMCGCNKYLDERADDSLVVPETLQDLQALLDNSFVMNKGRTPSLGEGSADDFFLEDETYNALDAEYQRIYNWTIGDYRFQNDWSMAYEPVYVANLCLEQLKEIPSTPLHQATWSNVKGSAHFFRSFYFLNLVWVFSQAYDSQTATTDLGIVLRLGSDFTKPSVRSSVQDCYDQIIMDAKEAATYLPDLPVHAMRPSKAAAYGLLARIYLSMRKYDSAYHYADEALQLKNELMDFNGDSDINGDISAHIPFRLFNKEIIFYAEMSTTNSIVLPSGARVDTSLYNSYHVDDLRRAGFFEASENYHQFKGSYSGDEWQLFTGIATDELHLIRAECLARTGHIDEAFQDLQILLNKRWNNATPPPQITGSTTAEATRLVLQERRKELLMRGLRWADIKRLNKEGEVIQLNRKISGQTYSLNPNAPYFALPLPADIIEETGISQNPR